MFKCHTAFYVRYAEVNIKIEVSFMINVDKIITQYLNVLSSYVILLPFEAFNPKVHFIHSFQWLYSPLLGPSLFFTFISLIHRR
jgi:hypothetical protein